MNRKSLIFIILGLVLGMTLGVGGTLGTQKLVNNSSETKDEVVDTQKTGPLLPIGEFTVNLQGGALLRTSITVRVTDEKAVSYLKEEDAFLKDRVNTVLANKSLVDVRTSDAREVLRKELLARLNEVAENKITDVLFPSFVYQ